MVSVAFHLSVVSLIWPIINYNWHMPHFREQRSMIVEFDSSLISHQQQLISRPRADSHLPMIESLSATTLPARENSKPETQRLTPVAPADTETPLIKPQYDADYLHNPKPIYPLLAKRLGEHGKVLLRVLVNREGNVAEILIVTSSGSSRLDDAAYQAVSRWRFVPAMRGEMKVDADVFVPINFVLDS